MTPAGTNRELALLRSALNLAVERRLIAYSPFAGVKLFKEEKYRQIPRILSFNEEIRLLAYCDFRLYTLVVCLLETGMRVGIEALRLKWENVNFAESTVIIVFSKTVAGRRVIPLTSFCKTALLKWNTETKGDLRLRFLQPAAAEHIYLQRKNGLAQCPATIGTSFISPVQHPAYVCHAFGGCWSPGHCH